MKSTHYFVYLIFALLLSSCGLRQITGSDNEESESEEVSTTENETQVLHVCPMCDGNKRITDIYSGSIIECPACEGYGVVTEEMAEKLLEAQRIGTEIAGGSYNESNNGYGDSNLQLEIEQCEREIANLENALSSIDENSTLYAYYSGELINLKYRLKQLQMQQR